MSKFDADGREMIEVPTGGGGGGSGGVMIQAGTQTATSGTVNFAIQPSQCPVAVPAPAVRLPLIQR